ncbi:MAG TPA: hypothetical protein VLA11_09005, partial [Woeseiaceae bacterium]|nr:hypothetical protein [Woeseiaceae bacterium]
RRAILVGVVYMQHFSDETIRRVIICLLESLNVSQLGNIRTLTGAADPGIEYESISIRPADSQ